MFEKEKVIDTLKGEPVLGLESPELQALVDPPIAGAESKFGGGEEEAPRPAIGRRGWKS